MCKVYNISSQIIEKPQAGRQPGIIKTNEIIINPDGTLSTQERELTYEEFAKTDQGQKKRDILGLKFGKRPISKKEFVELREGVAGKFGRMKISISKNETPQQLEDYEEFMLSQLDLKELDPTQSGDFNYILSEVGAVSLIRNEAARATGVSIRQMTNILHSNFLQTHLGKEIEDITSSIDQRFEEERLKESEKTKERLVEERQKHSFEALNSQLRQKKENLIRKLEEVKNKQKKPEDQLKPSEQMIDAKKIKESLESRCLQLLKDNNFKIKSLLHISGKEFDPSAGYDELDFLEMQKAQLTAELETTAPTEQNLRNELTSWQQEIRDLRKQGAISAQVIQTEQGATRLEINKEAVDSYILEVNKEIEDIKAKLNSYDEKRTQKAEVEKKIVTYRRLLDSSLTINGQNKTLIEWLEEYRVQTVEGGATELELSELENEIAKIDVVLDYFSEDKLNQRKQREINFDFIEPVPDEDLKTLNPELFNLLDVTNIDRNNTLKILETVFSKDLILPTNREDQEVKNLSIFLRENETLLESLVLEVFNKKMETIRRELLVPKQNAE